MSKYNTPENVCNGLTVFIREIRGQTAVLRAYDNIFKEKRCDSSFLNRAYESIWRELLSEIARVFDKSFTGSSENCTLLRLKELCLEEQYLYLFPGGRQNSLIQSIDLLHQRYNKLRIGKSRNKQLAHHDLKQVVEGACITISLDQIEQLVLDVTNVFANIYEQFCFGCCEISFWTGC